jgi:hypothetical protein
MELEASLQHELDRQALEHHLDGAGRVVWLLEQLENYLQRWAGLGRSPSDDLCLMVEIGAEAVAAELHRLDPLVTGENWRDFLAVVRAGNGPSEVEQLAKLLAVFRTQFCPGQFLPDAANSRPAVDE